MRNTMSYQDPNGVFTKKKEKKKEKEKTENCLKCQVDWLKVHKWTTLYKAGSDAHGIFSASAPSSRITDEIRWDAPGLINLLTPGVFGGGLGPSKG